MNKWQIDLTNEQKTVVIYDVKAPEELRLSVRASMEISDYEYWVSDSDLDYLNNKLNHEFERTKLN